MFTGIVHSTGRIIALEKAENFRTVRIEVHPDVIQGLETGASVCVDGVCLTVTGIEGTALQFDIIQSTLECTTLSGVAVGDRVNIERSLRPTSEVGGHDVSGHVDTTAVVRTVATSSHNRELTFEMGASFVRYLFPKGFIAINGVSLTIASVDRAVGTWTVWLIPETLRRTNLGQLTEGDRANIELHKGTQVLVDAIEDVVKTYLSQGQLDAEKVQNL